MAEELSKPNELNEPKEPGQPEPGSDHASTPDELEGIRALLAQEQAVLAEAQAQLTEKDERLAQLEAQLTQVRAERSNLQEAHTAAIGKYLAAVKASNPALPPDAITGATIEAIDASLGTALSIAGAVKANLEAEAKNSRVPAGAPTRVLDMEALTPTEKIKLGLSTEKGGTS